LDQRQIQILGSYKGYKARAMLDEYEIEKLKKQLEDAQTEIDRLRKALKQIQELAEEVIRMGETGDIYQIEANIRAALKIGA